MPDWESVLADAERRHGERLAAEPVGKRRDLQLAAIASASWAAGLALLMLGRRDEAAARLQQAADEYDLSAASAPSGSWGRPLAALRCRLLAGDEEGAAADAGRVLEQGADADESAVASYAAVLAELALARDDDAALLAAALGGRSDFPGEVPDALAALARRDAAAYEQAVRRVLRSFETRDAYLEDVPVADTVLVLQALAAKRGLAPALESPLLPA